MLIFLKKNLPMYKLHLEPNNVTKIPRSRPKISHLNALDFTDAPIEVDRISPHLSTTDVETTSPSGHSEPSPHHLPQALELTSDHNELENRNCPLLSAADVELTSPSGDFLPNSELQPRDVESSPEKSVYGCCSNLEDLGEMTGFNENMDSCQLMSAATTIKAEALIMIMSHAARHNITGTQR
ncbi:uncharacterized protein LOC120827876 [Gasterosteus aculeatus]|uniref:uncharacterized protein LOC120827876 isoform X2 n=1 Tax=Gasterosteus aculeatus aculeatus TaxID=481459 RepID=UPI001A99BCC7|nr:uncharacterized protein LOC120827876 isoform X2 [Gasterosteus aculeatus aculeatus]